MTTEELLEEIALVSDAADNCHYAAQIPLISDAVHVEELGRAMLRIRDRLRSICIENGKNPWAE